MGNEMVLFFLLIPLLPIGLFLAFLLSLGIWLLRSSINNLMDSISHKSGRQRCEEPSFIVPPNTHVLIVIAHPDDECMFFSPTILICARRSCTISILCLSNGVVALIILIYFFCVCVCVYVEGQIIAYSQCSLFISSQSSFSPSSLPLFPIYQSCLLRRRFYITLSSM